MSADSSPGFVSLLEFVYVDEPGAEPLLGDSDEVLIPQGGDMMIYGDGGAGKTTLQIDLAFHLAAGDSWCGIIVPRPLRVGVIENEGPRPLFRKKLLRKVDAWAGSDLGDRLQILAQPWARFTFVDERHRVWLADQISVLELDIVFAGPLTRIGMNEAGTLQETRDFSALLADVRNRVDRQVTFSLTHHENKGGQVSGAWEGTGDLLFHVQAQGNGRTRLYVQKARWSSDWHGKALHLAWTDGEGFALTDAAEQTANEIADAILQAARANGGQSWNTIQTIIGGNAPKARQIRDQLLNGGRLINTGKTRTMLLWDATDSLCPLRLDTDAPQDTPEGEGGSDVSCVLCPTLKGDTGTADTPTPSPNAGKKRSPTPQSA